MKKCLLWALSIMASSVLQNPLYAVDGLTIKPAGGNAVLSWTSKEGETYLVRFKTTVDSSTTWQTLASGYSAAVGTNVTSFVHTNQVPLSAGASVANMATNSSTLTFSKLSTQSAQLDSGSDDVPDLIIPPLPPGFAELLGLNRMSSVAQTSDISLPGDEASPTNTYPNTTPAPTCGFYEVVVNGVQLCGVTNGAVLSDYVFLPVEFGNDSGTISSLSLLDNGVPVPNSVLMPPFSYPIGFDVDSLMVSNGVHQLTVSAQWNDTNGGQWQAESAPVSVTTSNEVTFENWMPLFGETGNSLLIRATSAHPDTEWWIDVYNVTNNNYHYIGTFEGHTYDGDIAATWGLVGPHGESYSGSDAFVFEVATEYVDPPTPPTYKQKEPWLGKGAWAMVAQHAWDDSYDTTSLYSELYGFVGIAQQMGCNVFPSPDQDGNPYALHLTDPTDTQGDTEWANFRQALFNPATHNLVYFGHGGQTGLGHNTANTNRFITATEIGTVLHTLPAGQTNRHNFRFVFIDACATSQGLIPEAFGIFHRENVPPNDYGDASLRPSAYVGWPKDKAIGLMQDARYPNYDHIHFIQAIQMQLTLNGKGIKEAVRLASHSPDVHGAFGENDLKVYGYWDLTIGGYNQ